MTTPHRRPELPASTATNASTVLEPEAELTEKLHEAEVQLAIESAISRLLGFALERGAEEHGADD